MTIRSPFKPHYSSNQVVAPASTSANITINADDKSVRVCNSGANIGYFRIGQNAQTATTADTPVLPNQCLIVEKDAMHNNIAHISASGTTFQIQTGEGGQ